MPRIPFPGFCGPTYIAASPVLDAQRAINFYWEPLLPTSKSQAGLVGRPGLSQTGFATTINSPVRALWAGNNRLFGVGGTHFYELNGGGGVLTDFGAMAGSGGTNYCTVISNQPQLLVYDSSVPAIFYANPGGPSMTKVFDGTALEYLDGFYVAIATGASLAGTNPNQINVSALNDGTSWPALNFALRTGSADLTNGLAVLNGQLWIFGQKSIEVWYNAGNPGFPFARIQGSTINLGCIAPGSITKFYNTVMWLGADDHGYPQVYMSKGLSPVRVSNFSIEGLLGTVNTAAILPLATAFGYQESGHTFYVLNINNASYQPIQTLVYDLTTGVWHERSYGITSPWPSCFASVPGFNSNGPNFVGDGLSGKVMFQGIGYTSDLGNNITYTRTAPHVSKTNEWVKHSRFELSGDFGTAAPTLDYSDDGGKNFGSRSIALRQAQDQGRGSTSPTFRRFFANQLGRSRDRVYKVTISDKDNLIRIADAYLDISPGTEQ